MLRVLIGRPQSLSLWRRGGSLAVFRENPEWCLELAGLVFQDRLSGEVHWRIMCGNLFRRERACRGGGAGEANDPRNREGWEGWFSVFQWDVLKSDGALILLAMAARPIRP